MMDEDLWAKSQPNDLKNFTTRFPGGTHGYWLLMEETLYGHDDIYSTPIIVASQP